MAKRHNEYSRLLGTVENDIVPLTEQAHTPAVPMTGVPDLGMMGQDCALMAEQLNHHADKLKAMGDMQPDFNEQFDGSPESLPGGY